MKKNNHYEYYKVHKVNNLKEMVEYSADKHSDETAFMFARDGKEMSVKYSQFKSDVDALGTYFYSMGIKNEPIVVYGENSYEWILTYFAAVNGSNIIVPVDKELGGAELSNLVNDSEAKIVVYSTARAGAVEEFKHSMTMVERYISTDEIQECIDSGMALIKAGNYEFLNNKIDAEKMCALIYTSGTTGKPKGVMLSHKNLAACVVNSCANLKEPRDTVAVLPLNHTFGMMACVLCQVFEGHKVYINNNLRNILKDINTLKPGHISVVPLFVETFYKKIWKNAEKSGKANMLRTLIKISNALLKLGIDLRKVFFKSVINAFGGNLEMIISGGAQIDHKYMKGFEELGIRVINGYGITECSPIVSTNRNEDYRFGSVGLAIPGTEVRVDSPNEEGEGELLVKGDIVMLGYYKNTEATEAVFDGEWFKTGDIGKIDDDGFIYITGRKKNIIILSNGKNVYPEEIEAVVLNVEGVNEVLVYGKDDVICAEIYTEIPEEKERIKKDVQALNTQLPVHKQIKNISFRDTEFEKTSTKKIKRFLY